jgi:hypothetical protein
MDTIKLKAQFIRNEAGLLDGVDYILDETGRIDWRKMVKSEFIVPNSQKTDETDVTKLEDSDLLILLAGLKNLAELRGYSRVRFAPSGNDTYCCVVCSIDWLPNYETGGQPVSFEAMADASANNTEDFGKYYLAAIAENRAFARCVRNFLRINIVSKEEVGKSLKKRSYTKNSQHVEILQKLMDEKSLNFDEIKSKLINENYPEAEKVTCLEDINKEKLFNLIDRLKKFKRAS